MNSRLTVIALAATAASLAFPTTASAHASDNPPPPVKPSAGQQIGEAADNLNVLPAFPEPTYSAFK